MAGGELENPLAVVVNVRVWIEPVLEQDRPALAVFAISLSAMKVMVDRAGNEADILPDTVMRPRCHWSSMCL
jgi:hypothetical protein